METGPEPITNPYLIFRFGIKSQSSEKMREMKAIQNLYVYKYDRPTAIFIQKSNKNVLKVYIMTQSKTPLGLIKIDVSELMFEDQANGKRYMAQILKDRRGSKIGEVDLSVKCYFSCLFTAYNFTVENRTGMVIKNPYIILKIDEKQDAS